MSTKVSALVVCLPPLWSTGTKPRGDTSGQGAIGEPFLPTTPSRCCGREGHVSQVTALSSAHSTRRHSICGTRLQIAGTARLPHALLPPPPSPAKPQTAKAREAQGAMKPSGKTSLRPLGGRESLSRLKRPSLPATPLTLRCPWEPAKPARSKGRSLCVLSSRAGAQPPRLRPRAKRLLFWSEGSDLTLAEV